MNPQKRMEITMGIIRKAVDDYLLYKDEVSLKGANGSTYHIYNRNNKWEKPVDEKTSEEERD